MPTTPDGIAFGLLGGKPVSPAPTIFLFSQSIDRALEHEFYDELRRALLERGCIFVSLDIPGHGADGTEEDRPEVPFAPGARSYLYGWRLRMEKGDNVIPAFTAKASSVLDYLIEEGYTDAGKVISAGSSRGAFIALHFAAADPRVRCTAAMIPVTNLLALYEFRGMEDNEIVDSMAVANLTEKLAGRSVWVSIGHSDKRVSTDDAISFTRRLVKASHSLGKASDVTLYVYPAEGHSCTAESQQKAAAWIAEQLEDRDGSNELT